MTISAISLATMILLLFLFIKVPVFVSILAGAGTYFLFTPRTSNLILVQRVIAGTESIPLLAIPFFICAGVFMNQAGVTQRIMEFATVLVGRMSGGLAQVNVLLSTLMGGLSGSNLADAAMEAKMLCPVMERNGFSKPFSSVVTATSAMITPLIPPGIGMILYGSIANVSIGRLFVSGIGVGVILCVALLVLVSIISKRRGYKPLRDTPITFPEFYRALRSAFLPLCLPVIIIGGIRLGVFTPTEAGSVAIMYSFALGLLYRELNFAKTIAALKDTVITTAAIMLIVGTASALAWVFTKERIPQTLTRLMVESIRNKYVFLLIINAFLIVVGMFVEGNASTIVLVPLLTPMARVFGINDIQFGMIFIFNMAIGSMSPPMGTLMFVTCGITRCRISDFIKESIPFFAMLIVCLLLLTFLPILTTGLVSLVY